MAITRAFISAENRRIMAARATNGFRYYVDGTKPADKPDTSTDENTDDDAELDEDGNPIPIPPGEEDAVACWPRAVDAQMASCGGNRFKAVSKVERLHPGLRARFVKQSNRRTQLAQARRRR